MTRSTLVVMVNSWTTPSLPQKRTPCARRQFTATPQQRGLAWFRVLPPESLKEVSRDKDVDSDAATRAHRQRERPVLVSIVLVWCVDRFTRRDDAAAYGHRKVSMATVSLKRTSRSKASVGRHTQKCSHSSLFCTVVAFSLLRCVHCCPWLKSH